MPRIFCRWLPLALILLLFLATPVAAARQRALIWEVVGPKGTLYLMGSIHLRAEGDLDLPGIENIYRQSKTLFFETDISSLDSPAWQTEMMTQGLYPPGESLAKDLPPSLMSNLKKRAEEHGLPLEALTRLRPWLAALTLVSLELRKQGLNPANGVDRILYQRAGADGKERRYLEKPEEQLALFADMAVLRQKEFLAQSLEEIDGLAERLDRLISAWKEGDAEKLAAILEEGFKDYPEIRQRFLSDRNRRWLPALEKVLRKEETNLAVVGAGHLVGPDNLVDLFAARGYTTLRLEPPEQ